jgi:hypothetical protein
VPISYDLRVRNLYLETHIRLTNSIIAPMKIISASTMAAFAMMAAVAFTGCNKDDDELEKQPFAGSWVILQAVKDGISMDNWKDIIIELKQTDNTSGTFVVEGSPHIGIWAESGRWSMANADEHDFRRDDDVWVYYSLIEDTMVLQFLIPEPAEPCEPADEGCTLQVSGEWTFVLDKK